MKTLLVFADMIRIDLLSVYNHQLAHTSIDQLINTMGGKVYTNCYTPAPDTPRSLACFQTGLYPAFNGCDTRIKWPKFYIKKEVDTIFDILSINGVKINYYSPQGDIDTGIVSIKDENKIDFFTDFDLFSSNILANDCDEFDFITLDDYHWAIDDYRANMFAVKRGHDIVSDTLNIFFQKHPYNEFDHIFFFSDHGHILDKEKAAMRSPLELLHDNRTKILMFHHSKNDCNLLYDGRLCSILDLYSSLLSIYRLKYDKRDSISLLNPQGGLHNYLVIEDHADFTVSLNQVISLWRYISEEGSFYTNIYELKKEGIFDTADDIIETLIQSKSPTYVEVKKQISILQEYSKMVANRGTYSNGIKRLNSKLVFVFKVKSKCLRLICKCLGLKRIGF